MEAATIAQELITVVTRVGLPEEILIDQGTNFTFQLFKQVCQLLRINHL